MKCSFSYDVEREAEPSMFVVGTSRGGGRIEVDTLPTSDIFYAQMTQPSVQVTWVSDVLRSGREIVTNGNSQSTSNPTRGGSTNSVSSQSTHARHLEEKRSPRRPGGYAAHMYTRRVSLVQARNVSWTVCGDHVKVRLRGEIDLLEDTPTVGRLEGRGEARKQYAGRDTERGGSGEEREEDEWDEEKHEEEKEAVCMYVRYDTPRRQSATLRD